MRFDGSRPALRVALERMMKQSKSSRQDKVQAPYVGPIPQGKQGVPSVHRTAPATPPLMRLVPRHCFARKFCPRRTRLLALPTAKPFHHNLVTIS